MADRKITELGAAEAQDLTNNNALLHLINPDRALAVDQNRKMTIAQLRDTVITLAPTTLGVSGTIDIDFAGAAYRTQGPLTGNVTFTGSNYTAGRSVTIRVENGATLRTLTFPTNWVFVGVKPDDIDSDLIGILTVTSFGTSEADCVAAWAVSE